VNVLIVGGGGREHVLTWKIAQSVLVKNLFCVPGSPGIASYAECVNIGVEDFDAIEALCKEKGIELLVVGPEAPLAAGLADRFVDSNVKVFGPNAAAAQLEGSKVFAKQLMDRHDIPTAVYQEFTEADSAIAYIQEQGAPIVIKADGLAAGKGVVVAHTVEEATEAVNAMMCDKVFGESGAKIVVEECLVGEEASILAFTDGTSIVPMVTSQDHKPIFDGDKGPNTGGMGAYSPAPVVTPDLFEQIEREILKPCVDGMAADGYPYCGVVYAGLMITSDGPKVIEFNCRFGDPECQVVLPRLQTDIVPVLLACCENTLDKVELDWDGNACVSVVMASAGYPGSYEKGKPITGIAEAEADGAIVFQAGTGGTPEALVTNGGRVLNVTALGDGIPDAIEKAYAAVEKVSFEGAQHRTDIGKKALARLGD
jgi:phosphoribosylamine--glycine ligase